MSNGELRVEALRQAVNLGQAGIITAEEIPARAEAFYKFLISSQE